MDLIDFNTLRKNLKKDFSSLKKLRVAILGDSATQFLAQAVRGYGYERAYDLEIFEADYDQVDLQVFDERSAMYNFHPDFVIIFCSVRKLLKNFYNTPKDHRKNFAEKKAEWFSSIGEAISSRTHARIICMNFPAHDDSVFGNYANKVESSFTWQLRSLNMNLMKWAADKKNIFIADVAMLQSRFGNEIMSDPKMYLSADMIFSLDFIPHVAKSLVDIILSIDGTFHKCLILDLDNTLWGGIIGDDGIENIQIGDLGAGKAFTGLQLWAKQLKERGIIIAVCSKNDEKIAKEPFEKHPDMVLRMEDIAVFAANWESKIDNIKYIQSVLQVGFDSMVFIDDNPFERNIIREHLPAVTVPELPEDPAEYLDHLQSLNLFETASVSEEDEQRTKQYQKEAERNVAQRSFTSEKDFLESLEMVSVIKHFDKFSTPRIAQLSQRSNQFNLRTVRYTESEIETLSSSKEHIHLTFTLVDKFGDNGLIAVIILKKIKPDAWFIDTWLMSCRVLRRGMENFALNTIVKQVRDKGGKILIGEYIPTAKNIMVKEHYRDLGFKERNGQWQLDLEKYPERPCFIRADYQNGKE
ncbi:MAG: HAD-IIIC family phosphatase [Bacteroidetes bacterium]|nr:HAD-IIIC family phosphatase [Bacteroidota bacterium]